MEEDPPIVETMNEETAVKEETEEPTPAPETPAPARPEPPVAIPGESTRVVLPTPEEFVADENGKLGRANGNIYHRKPGIEGVNDGQIMVRLKKKRFIVIDYNILPEDAPEGAVVQDGAGKQKCISPQCNKVGIPVLLFDSEPSEPSSLYMRSGLCFTCQRTLNEKRRTQRKRKSDDGVDGSSGTPHHKKKAKLSTGEIIDLSPDAIIINGPVNGAKPHGEGYGFHEIGLDLQAVIQEATSDTERLITASEDITSLYEKAFTSLKKGVYLMSQWKASWDAAIAAAVAQETVNDAGLADAVASAAAVVAAAGLETQDQNSANMIPLLLAAEAKGDDGDKEEKKSATEGDEGEQQEAAGEGAPVPAEEEAPEAAAPAEGGGENVEMFSV